MELANSLPVGLEGSLWNSMPPNAQKVLLSAEMILSLDAPQFDYGLAVIGYFKAIEIALEEKLFRQFRNQVLARGGTGTVASLGDCQGEIAAPRSRAIHMLSRITRDPGIDVQRKLALVEEYILSLEQMEDEYDQEYRLRNYIFSQKALTLVDMAQILQYLKRVGDDASFGLLWSLKKFIKQHHTRGHRFWSTNRQLAIRIESIALADRNPAAHVEMYSKGRALAVRIEILGDRSKEGILVSVLKALA